MGVEFQRDCNVCTCQGEMGYICTKKECSTSYKMGDKKAMMPADIPESPTPPPTTAGKFSLEIPLLVIMTVVDTKQIH